jgi:hypothetical protein
MIHEIDIRVPTQAVVSCRDYGKGSSRPVHRPVDLSGGAVAMQVQGRVQGLARSGIGQKRGSLVARSPHASTPSWARLDEKTSGELAGRTDSRLRARQITAQEPRPEFADDIDAIVQAMVADKLIHLDIANDVYRLARQRHWKFEEARAP